MSNISEKFDRKAATYSKILLTLVPQILQMQCKSTLTTNVRPTSTTTSHASTTSYPALEKCSKRVTKRQRGGRIGKKQLFASCCMSLTNTPFVTKGDLLGNLKDQTGGERRLWKRERSSMWWDVVVKDHWTDNDWIEHFRMSKATFMFICEKMRDKITYHNTNMRRALPVEQRMAITIWRLATNCGYRIISDLFGVGRSTVCMIIQQTCKAFASSMQKEFMEVFTPGKVQVTIDSFMNKYGFPQVGGCIGTCQIPIKLPESNHSMDCISAKGNPSIFLQGIVDEKGQFMDMTAGRYGSTSEVQVFSQSHLYEAASKGTLFPNSAIDIEGVNVPAQLLAGPGYPLLPNVTTAYYTQEGQLANQQHLFNQQVADVRRVVDKAFSRLKGRWQILMRRNEHKIALIPSIATTCCILHNICEQRDEVFNIDLMDGQEDIETPAVPTIKQEDTVAQNNRTALTLNIYKNLGPL